MDRRVLRGGAWNNDQVNARAANRNENRRQAAVASRRLFCLASPDCIQHPLFKPLV
jgi:hypothetical protein